ncbi:MAG: flagellar basal body-associated FliL family protein [Pseudomonadota bacterium]
MIRMLAVLLTLAAAPGTFAADSPAPEPGAESDQGLYVPLEPSFVTNFGAAGDGGLMFLKADVAIRATDQAGASAARYHLPALRNALVLLLSRQDEAAVSSSRGREAIRARAVAELRSLLEAEEGAPCIEDVLFTNFVVQR